jgi:general L-amino acid transport system permease protein
MSSAITPIKPRRAPAPARGLKVWLCKNLFSTASNTLISLICFIVLGLLTSFVIRWGVLNAVTAPDPNACQAARGAGACWGVISEKARIILLGRYPRMEHWRAELTSFLLVGFVVASCSRWFWKPWAALLWPVVLAVCFFLMRGGVFGLTAVSTDQWGGLPLTVILTVTSMIAAFPLAILLALGRRSSATAIHIACATYIELIRAVPLVALLFMASFMFPLLMPEGRSPDVLLRVIAGITLFAAAYLAEIIRGGLQAVPEGQREASASLGLGYWKTQIAVVLPQALSIGLPGIMNSIISLFKNTSLVAIVSLYDLTGAFSLAMNSEPSWRPFKLEAYLFIAGIYFCFCFSMSRYSLNVERRLASSKTRHNPNE